MMKMKRSIALILVLVIVMGLVACGGDKPSSTPGSTPSNPGNPTTSTPSNPSTSTPSDKPAEDPDSWKYGGNLRIGENQKTTTMDIGASNGSVGNTRWMMHIYESLCVLDANGKVYGQICDFEESADGLTVKLTLRDRYFSNGKKITMDDLWASLQRAAAVVTDSNYDKLWKDTDIKVEGNTIIFTLKTTNLNFLPTLASASGSYKVMPKEICEKYPFVGGELQSNGLIKGGELEKQINVEADVIGSGPYKLTSWSELEIVLDRNENYEGIENEGAIGVAAYNHAYMDTITININADSSSSTAAIMAGEYDFLTAGSIEKELIEPRGIVSGDAGTTWTFGMFFNLNECNADSPVANVNVRKAIRACLDVTAVMLSASAGDISRVNVDPYPVRNTTPYASTKMEDSGEFNVANKELAKEYLKKANYNGEEIVLLTSATGSFYNIAIIAIPMMEEVGIKVNLMAVDSGSHSAIRKDATSGFDIGMWQVQKRDENPVLHSTIVTGTQGWWSSPAKDAAIAVMRSTPTGSPESVAAYNDYLDAVIDECPYILFGHPTGLIYYHSYLNWQSPGSTLHYWNSYFNKDHKQ